MARRRLLTVLASTLAAGILALPAMALPGLTDPIDDAADVVVTTVETATDALVTDVAGADADEAETSDDDGLLPTGEGELLEPLAPVTDPVEQALAPVLDALDPAEPVVEVVDEAVDTVTDLLGSAADLPTGERGTPEVPAIPGGSDAGPAPAGDNAPRSAVLETATPDLSALDSYWAGPGVSRDAAVAKRSVSKQEAPATADALEPLTAPAAQQPQAADAITDIAPAGWEAVVKVFAAALVAATASLWQRAYAKAQVRR